MLLFVAWVGVRRAPADRITHALAQVARVVPNLDPRRIATRVSASQRTALAYVSHDPALAGTRQYVSDRGEGLWLFDGLPITRGGRPVRRADELHGVDSLDGAGVGVCVDLARDRLELLTPSLGMAPAFVAATPDGGHAVSNSVDALRRLLDLRDPDPLGVSTFLTLGWAVADRTLTDGIRALPAGSRVSVVDSSVVVDESFGASAVEAALATTAAPRTAELAAFLVDAVRRVGEASGQVQCALTAGRDSRLCLALVRAAGIDATYYTNGEVGEIDVSVARELASRLGVHHEVIPTRAHAGVDPETVARTFVVQNDGMRSFEQITDQDMELTRPPSLAVRVTGVGGEIARLGSIPLYALARNLGPVSRAPRFQRALLEAKAQPGEGVVRSRALTETRGYLHAFVARRRAERWPTETASDAFYVLERTRRWAATTPRQAAPTADVFSPFFSRVFAEAALTGGRTRQLGESLHYDLLTELDPSLRDVRFAKPWPRQTVTCPGLRAVGLAARTLGSRVSRSGDARSHLRRGAAPRARDRIASAAELHASVAAGAARSPLSELVDTEALRRALTTTPRLGPVGLRALTALWWFETGPGGMLGL